MSNGKAPRPRVRCPICERKIRGSNHKEGSHHKAKAGG